VRTGAGKVGNSGFKMSKAALILDCCSMEYWCSTEKRDDDSTAKPAGLSGMGFE
jgi:hypothetical protein